MSLSVEVKNVEGKKVGSVDLPSELFDAQTNVPLIHQVVTAQLAAARQGTQKAKNRGETSGSGRSLSSRKEPVARVKVLFAHLYNVVVELRTQFVHAIMHSAHQRR
jgi:ribosomal protein L4